MVRELLAHRADVNQVNNYGRTALIEAAFKNNLEMVRDLISYGADESYLKEYQKTQFKEAIAEGEEMMKTNYLVKLVERKTILDQAKRSNDSNLSKLPRDVINLITEFSLDAKHPSNVQAQDIKAAIQYGEDKFSYKLFKRAG